MKPLIGILFVSPFTLFIGWSLGRWTRRKVFRIATQEELDEIEGRDQ